MPVIFNFDCLSDEQPLPETTWKSSCSSKPLAIMRLLLRLRMKWLHENITGQVIQHLRQECMCVWAGLVAAIVQVFVWPQGRKAWKTWPGGSAGSSKVAAARPLLSVYNAISAGTAAKLAMQAAHMDFMDALMTVKEDILCKRAPFMLDFVLLVVQEVTVAKKTPTPRIRTTNPPIMSCPRDLSGPT